MQCFYPSFSVYMVISKRQPWFSIDCLRQVHSLKYRVGAAVYYRQLISKFSTHTKKDCSLTRDLLSLQYHDLVFLHLQSFQSLIFTPDLDATVTQVLKQLTILRE